MRGARALSDRGPLDQSPGRDGHGFWPYWLPYLALLVLIEIGRRTPEDWALGMLLCKTGVPAALLLFYLVRGAYPELRGPRLTWRGTGLDVLVGLGSALLWIAPYLIFAALRPADAQGFDAGRFGDEAATLALSTRAVGFALVTPFVEELFIRSWLLRYSHVILRGTDFRSVPIGHFSWPSFLITGTAFTISHAVWEYPVASVWFVLTTLWLYKRKQLFSLVVVHAVANASILFWVVVSDGRWLDGAGRPLSLWFFL